MSQIPTYVTAVPNGTEKVRLLSDELLSSQLTHRRACTWQLILGALTFVSAQSNYMEIQPSASLSQKFPFREH
jgi:hypothetical protein